MMTLNLYEKMQQVETLKNVEGLESLLTESYKILGNPLIMLDNDCRLITSNENVVTDDPLWNDIVINGSLGHKLQEIIKEEGFYDDIASAFAITFLTSDKIRHNRILGKLFDKNNKHVASLCIIENNRSFEYDDPVLFEAVCQIFSEEISSTENYDGYGTNLEETVIKKLIEGDIADKKIYSVHIATLYNGLKENLFTAVIGATYNNIDYRSLESFRDLLLKVYPNLKCAIYANNIVAIFSSDRETIDVKKDLNKLEKLLKQRRMHAGVSRRFGNLFTLSLYYNEAKDLLKMGIQGRSTKKIFLFDEGSENT